MKHLTKLLSVVSWPQVTVFMNYGKRKKHIAFQPNLQLNAYVSGLGARRGIAPLLHLNELGQKLFVGLAPLLPSNLPPTIVKFNKVHLFILYEKWILRNP